MELKENEGCKRAKQWRKGCRLRKKEKGEDDRKEGTLEGQGKGGENHRRK